MSAFLLGLGWAIPFMVDTLCAALFRVKGESCDTRDWEF